jgi:hypothetical protein
MSDKMVPEWRQFEKLVARIEADAAPLGLSVVSPDRIRCKITGRLREVDASIRMKNNKDIIVTIECRRHRCKQDVTWIEQLAAKKHAIGAIRTIAVSSSGFTKGAVEMAHHHGIDLRILSEVSAKEINQMMRLDFILFTHKRCVLIHIAIRPFRAEPWKIPDTNEIELSLPNTTDLFAPIFRNIETKATWSINDLWLQLQDVTDPFAGIEKGEPMVVRTACFPYPGNVMVGTLDGEVQLGDILLSIGVWLEVEQVDLESARKVEYKAQTGGNLQRIEFSSTESGLEDWRITLQFPKNSTDIRELRTGGNWPKYVSKK